MSIRQLQNGKFQAYVTDKDRQRYRKNFDSKVEAQAWEADTRMRIIAGKPVDIGIGGYETFTLATAMKRAYDERWRGTKGGGTAMRNAQSVINFFGPKTDVNKISTLRVQDLISHLETTNSGATINRKLAALSVMLKVAYKYDKLTRMPMIERRRETQSHPRFLTEAEFEYLMQTAHESGRDELAAAMVISAYTGMRQSELLSLPWKNANLDANEVILLDTKNGRPNRIPLPERAQEAFATLERKGDRVFSGYHKDKLIYEWRQLNERCDTKFRWHDLRHTYGSWLAQRGVPIETISRLMNHSNISVTMRYAYLAPSNLHDAVGVL